MDLLRRIETARDYPLIAAFENNCPELMTIARLTLRSALAQDAELGRDGERSAAVAAAAAAAAAAAETLDHHEIGRCMDRLRTRFLISSLGRDEFPDFPIVPPDGWFKIVAFVSEFRVAEWGADELAAWPHPVRAPGGTEGGMPCFCPSTCPSTCPSPGADDGGRSQHVLHFGVVSVVLNGEWMFPLRIRGLCADRSGRAGCTWLDGSVVTESMRREWKLPGKALMARCFFCDHGVDGCGCEAMFFHPLMVATSVEERSRFYRAGGGGRCGVRRWPGPSTDVVGLTEEQLSSGLVGDRLELEP